MDDLRLIRALLRAHSTDAVVQDQLDCAELALEIGERDIAAMLYGASCLRLGFSVEARARFVEINDRTKLWPEFTPSDRQDLDKSFSVDRALAELTQLIKLAVPGGAQIIDLGSIAVEDVDTRRTPTAIAGRAALAERASDLLREVPAAAAEGTLASLLHAARIDIATIPPVRLEEHIDVPPPALAALYALEQLRRFLVANGDLLDGDKAMPGLFDAALNLFPAALGPFFSNVPLIIRDARDIFNLIELAGRDGISQPAIQQWCLLLSAHLKRHQLIELIDVLGDRGMRTALAQLLTRTARANGPPYPAEIIWRIRDVCMDIAEWEIAADAQQVIALWRPHDVNEWRILADIRTALNDPIGADGALKHALALRPDDSETRRRLSAFNVGLLPPVEGGYSTSPGRRRLRQARARAYRAMA